MPIKLLLLIAAAWIGWKLWRTWQQQGSINRPPRGPESFEPTVRCTGCGVHLPASAVSADGRCGKCSS